jgi:farnesyl-diphosphate farnesyltransferase
MTDAVASPDVPATDALADTGPDAAHALATERAWCREALLRVSRTFSLNIRCLRGRMLESVRVAYLLCRAADALEDSWPGSEAEVADRFDALLAALDGDPSAAWGLAGGAEAQPPRAELDVLARLPALLHVLDSLPEADAADVRLCVRTLATGMKRYAARAAARGPGTPYLDDDAELHDYCYVVAGCVGEMLTRLVARDIPGDDPALAARRLALAPVVGEALQLTNIVLDWSEDLRGGRCHVPGAWLERFGLAPADLLGPSAAARELSLRLAGLAHAALDRVPDYLETIPTSAHRFRLFCLLPAQWARASLELAQGRVDFHASPDRPRLSRPAILWEAARGVLAHGDHAATRRVLDGRAPVLE